MTQNLPQIILGLTVFGTQTSKHILPKIHEGLDNFFCNSLHFRLFSIEIKQKWLIGVGLNSGAWYLPLLWPVRQSGAAVEHNDVILYLGLLSKQHVNPTRSRWLKVFLVHQNQNYYQNLKKSKKSTCVWRSNKVFALFQC